MSQWTYVNGVIKVQPAGRTQAEKKYVLDTVLEHLPWVTGSEKDMEVYPIQVEGHNCSASFDEFGETTNNLKTYEGCRDRKGWRYTQENYILTVNGALRDREFKDTYKEFMKWICRLAKRVEITYVLVEIRDYYNSAVIHDVGDVYKTMYEWPSWSRDIHRNRRIQEKLEKIHPEYRKQREPAWYEYLLWRRMDDCMFPRVLGYKYYADEKNDQKVEPWLED